MLDWLIALLIWLSADPLAVDHVAPRAAAAVDAAFASMAREVPQVKPAVVPQAKPAQGGSVGGKPADCPTGNCPLPPR